jgi:hypothetical protein
MAAAPASSAPATLPASIPATTTLPATTTTTVGYNPAPCIFEAAGLLATVKQQTAQDDQKVLSQAQSAGTAQFYILNFSQTSSTLAALFDSLPSTICSDEYSAASRQRCVEGVLNQQLPQLDAARDLAWSDADSYRNTMKSIGDMAGGSVGAVISNVQGQYVATVMGGQELRDWHLTSDLSTCET